MNGCHESSPRHGDDECRLILVMLLSRRLRWFHNFVAEWDQRSADAILHVTSSTNAGKNARVIRSATSMGLAYHRRSGQSVKRLANNTSTVFAKSSALETVSRHVRCIVFLETCRHTVVAACQGSCFSPFSQCFIVVKWCKAMAQLPDALRKEET